MLQLATLSARSASEASDLLITRAVGAAPVADSTLPEVVSDRLAVAVAVRNLGDRQLRLTYRRHMIVNEVGYRMVSEPCSQFGGLAPHSRRL